MPIPTTQRSRVPEPLTPHYERAAMTTIRLDSHGVVFGWPLLVPRRQSIAANSPPSCGVGTDARRALQCGRDRLEVPFLRGARPWGAGELPSRPYRSRCSSVSTTLMGSTACVGVACASCLILEREVAQSVPQSLGLPAAPPPIARARSRTFAIPFRPRTEPADLARRRRGARAKWCLWITPAVRPAGCIAAGWKRYVTPDHLRDAEELWFSLPHVRTVRLHGPGSY